MHRKPYNSKYFTLSFLTPARYYGEVEMTEDGTPVGYEKKRAERSETPAKERKPHKKHAFKKQCIECGNTYKGRHGLAIHKTRSGH